LLPEHLYQEINPNQCFHYIIELRRFSKKQLLRVALY